MVIYIINSMAGSATSVLMAVLAARAEQPR
jgi:hypothetical protein